jgi:8-amino-7-oxononanoate synthase
MTGNPPDLEAFAAVAAKHNALLYVDDAHGFGVIGDRTPDELCPYGTSGNAIVRYFGLDYDNIVLVGGFSKAYSSLAAFITGPKELKDLIKVAAPPYAYSGPSPIASLATVLAGFEVNRKRGDQLRAELYRLTMRVLDGMDELGVYTPNRSGMPIIEIPLRDSSHIDEVGNELFDRGLFVTLARYPVVPRADVGFRVQLTSANTDAEVDRLLDAITDLVERDELRPVSEPELVSA